MEEKAEKTKTKVSPNIFLRVAGTFSLVYYGMSGSLFFLALIFVRFLTEMTEIYLPDFNLSTTITFIFVLAGFLLHLLAVIGLLMLMINGKKTGYLLFILSSIPILLIQMISLNYDSYQKIFLETGLIFFISLIYFLTPKGTYITDIMSVNKINNLNEE
ncbi:MAG: hypothetical protein Q7V19_02740 [Bacteroidales bacterium]|nr:hypothetical protein [Bacteroidales bacterium]